MKEQQGQLQPTAQIVDPAKLAANLAKVFEQSALLARVLADQSNPQKSDLESQILPSQMVSKTMQDVVQAYMRDPQNVMAAQTRLWEQYSAIWNNAWARATGAQVTPVVVPSKTDKRFKDEDWSDNTVYDAIKQFYLATSGWAQEMVRDAEGIDPHTRRKARFYVENILNMFSPSNFAATNPEVMKAVVASDGENLIRGLEKLREDLATPDGRLRIQQVDKRGFKLGENIATTPGKVVFRNDVFELIQYEPVGARAHAVPLLIVPPWINKYYILDLNAKKSFVKFCVENGLTVFIMSWANAQETAQPRQFSDYIREGFLEAVSAVQSATGSDKVNTVGFCIGGSMLATALGFMAAKGDDRIGATTFLTTQVDFNEAGDLKVYVDEEQVSWIEERMQPKGYLPGARMADAFNLLRSNDLIWSNVVNSYLLGKDPPPFDLLYWNSDSTRMPSAVHAFYLREFYIHNKLSQGLLEIDHTPIDLSAVKCPVYNLACRDDHIAPARSVFRLGAHFGGDVEMVVASSGHIAGVVNPPEAKKYSYRTDGKSSSSFGDWMTQATEHPGSWWTHWLEWITLHSGEKVPAPVPGDRDLKVLGVAPGENVKVSGVN
jgi:polyhydroxyalkanoate synthase subunit PhaC